MQDDLLKATTPTDITTLPPAQRAAIVLESTKAEAQLRELVSLSINITEVKDKAGREQAHRAGMTLKNARVGIEKIGKAAREDAKNFSNAVIAEEKRLVGIVEGEESRIFGLRDGWDAAEAARKAELERIEQERVRVIRAKIEQIKNLPHACLQDNAVELASTIEDLQALVPVAADFAEFVDEATSTRDSTIVAMQALHSTAVQREAEAVRLAAERAELDKLRAEQAERERVAAETKRQLEAQQAALAKQRQEQEAREAAIAADRAALERHQAELKEAAERAAAAPVEAPTIAEREGVAHISIDLEAAALDERNDQWVPAEQTAMVAQNKPALVLNAIEPTKRDVQILRAALRDALLTLSTEEVRAIVDDELQAAEAA